MKFDVANLFFLLVLSFPVIMVTCQDDDDDTSTIDAVDLSDGNLPDFGDGNPIECRETEVYSRCDANPFCQRNCFNLEDEIPCPRLPGRSCIDGCVCRSNYVRSELYGGCIPVDQCNRVKH